MDLGQAKAAFPEQFELDYMMETYWVEGRKTKLDFQHLFSRSVAFEEAQV